MTVIDTQVVVWASSLALAALMGFSIQRGATCTVAAVDECVRSGQTKRLFALAEAALWVGLGVLMAQHMGWLQKIPTGYELGWRTLAGGVLLGAGAYVNRACVFGAIARLSSGEWAYIATPMGYFLGCVIFLRIARSMGSSMAPDVAPALSLPTWVAAVGGALILARLVLGAVSMVQQHRLGATDPAGKQGLGLFMSTIWAPGPATVLIGLTFLGMFVLAGPWAYTDLLAEWAHGMAANTWGRAALAMALFAGAAWGGWRAGRWQLTTWQPSALLRCLAGGTLMGVGSLFIPGGNDGLILVGMPLLWPYAWVAFATMCVTIACLIGWNLRANKR